jgi:glutathione peroxidase
MPAFMKSKGLSFPVFAKISVNGDDTHPLFAWLKEKAPGYLVDAVKWNFTKFLVVDGVPVKRYGPNEPPLSIESDVVAAIRDVQLRTSKASETEAVTAPEL